MQKDESTILSLKEVSEILKVNTEVLRRWLREGRLPGFKLGSYWRVNAADLEPFLRPTTGASSKEKNPSGVSMCYKFPKWLEFSGLPETMNKSIDPAAWAVFKKLVELDFEAGRPESRLVSLDLLEISVRIGLETERVEQVFKKLCDDNYVTKTSRKGENYFSIVTPIRTPRLILDIDYEKGGVKGAPDYALENPCLRRFLESY